MKRLSAFLFIIIMLFSLCACGSETAPLPVSTGEPVQTPQPTQAPTPTPEPAFEGLPVVRLTTEDSGLFNSIYSGGIKGVEVVGSFSMFEGDKCLFDIPCCIEMSGNSNLISSAKKNMNIKFKKKFEQENLHYDVFDNGQEKHSSLSLRAGQDSSFRIFNQEIWQDLCLEMSDSLLTQYSRFCVLYIDEEYYGIYCLKDNISKGWYSDIVDVPKDYVLSISDQFAEPVDFYFNVYQPIKERDMSIDENYRTICDVLDIDAFIDWAIIEGVSANADLFANVRMFYTEQTGKWEVVLFDLDSAMKYDAPWASVFSDMQGVCYGNYVATNIIKALLKNEDFRAKLFSRYAEVYDTVLSNESVIEKADYYRALLEPEIEKDREKWGFTVGDWNKNIQSLYDLIEETNWQEHALEKFCQYAHVTEEERAVYFG